MLVMAAPPVSLIRVMWYSDGPGYDSNCHPKSEPQNSRPWAVSSAGISKCTIWPAIAVPLASSFGGACVPPCPSDQYRPGSQVEFIAAALGQLGAGERPTTEPACDRREPGEHCDGRRRADDGGRRLGQPLGHQRPSV